MGLQLFINYFIGQFELKLMPVKLSSLWLSSGLGICGSLLAAECSELNYFKKPKDMLALNNLLIVS